MHARVSGEFVRNVYDLIELQDPPLFLHIGSVSSCEAVTTCQLRSRGLGTPTGTPVCLQSQRTCLRKHWVPIKQQSFMCVPFTNAVTIYSRCIGDVHSTPVCMQSCHVKARDGTKLAVDILLPQSNPGNAPLPCVLFQAR